MESEFKCEYYVQYKDIDDSFELKLISALEMFQETSMQHGEYVKQGINQLYENGFTWISLGWNIKVLKKPRYLDKICVVTWTNNNIGATVLRQFKMIDEQGNDLILAEDRFALLDIKKRRISRIGSEVINKYVINDTRLILEEFPELKDDEEYDDNKEVQIRISDLDTNKHINNLKYIEYALNVIPIEEQNNIKNIKVNYKKEIRYMPYCMVSYKKVDNIYKIKINSKETTTANCLLEIKI